jgi:hypothetical protein
MHNDLIHKASSLMQDQAASYSRLISATHQLSSALVRGDLVMVESMTLKTETELFPMRSRLVQIMSTLTAFAEERAGSADNKITPEARAAFETASSDLLQAARDFHREQKTASALAVNGASFASSCIEMCGVQPTTYRAPYARRGEGMRWA